MFKNNQDYVELNDKMLYNYYINFIIQLTLERNQL